MPEFAWTDPRWLTHAAIAAVLCGALGCEREQGFGDAGAPDALDPPIDAAVFDNPAPFDAGGRPIDPAIDPNDPLNPVSSSNPPSDRDWECDSDGDTHRARFCLAGESGGDCDDREETIHPDAPELCNGLDDDCDGAFDEAPLRCDVTAALWDGEGRADLNEVAADTSGDSYVAGDFGRAFTLGAFEVAHPAPEDVVDHDGVVASIDRDGEGRWATIIGSPGDVFGEIGGPDAVQRVVASDGAVYVAGALGGAATVATTQGEVALVAGHYVARLAAGDGAIEWIRQLVQPDDDTLFFGKVSALALDRQGRVAVALHENSTEPGPTYLHMLDGGGELISSRATPWGHVHDLAAAAEPSQWLVLGEHYDGSDVACPAAAGTAFVMALDPDGACLWVAGAEPIEPEVARPPGLPFALTFTRLAVRDNGDIAIAGTTNGDFLFDGMMVQATPVPEDDWSDSDAFVLGVSPTGGGRFVYRYGSKGPDFGNGIAMDAEGRIYAALEVWQADTFVEKSTGMIVALSPHGEPLWQRDVLGVPFGALRIAAPAAGVLVATNVGSPSLPTVLEFPE